MKTAAPPGGPSCSPYRTFGEVPVALVADAVRQPFLCWGLPCRRRGDNGVPWGNGNDRPTLFALWVVGLGIDWHWNDPRRPQQNPKSERSQGTAKRWADPQQCRRVAELQAPLDRADENHRAHYRLRGGQTRMERFPERKHSGRPFTLAREKRHGSFPRVEAPLSA